MGAHIFVPSIGLRTGHKKVTDLRRYWLADVFTVVPIFTGSDKKQIKENRQRTLKLQEHIRENKQKQINKYKKL